MSEVSVVVFALSQECWKGKQFLFSRLKAVARSKYLKVKKRMFCIILSGSGISCAGLGFFGGHTWEICFVRTLTHVLLHVLGKKLESGIWVSDTNFTSQKPNWWVLARGKGTSDRLQNLNGSFWYFVFIDLLSRIHHWIMRAGQSWDLIFISLPIGSPYLECFFKVDLHNGEKQNYGQCDVMCSFFSCVF